MKKIFLILFFLSFLISLSCLKLQAQRKDTNDYFAVGLYGGAYNGHEENFLNSAAVEAEYFKFNDLSFYLQGIYSFSGSERRMEQTTINTSLRSEGHESQSLSVSFGGRYYLRLKKINPFFEAGLNHESNFERGHRDSVMQVDEHGLSDGGRRHSSGLSGLLGLGINYRINNKFKAEVKYDLYKSFNGFRDSFNNFSILAGVKYNL